MRKIENVVDFADLCIYAEQQGIAFYNEAHRVLEKDAYPWPESPTREVYLSEMKYLAPGKSRDILTSYMEKHGAQFITVMK